MEQHFFSNLSKGVVRTLSAAIALPLVLTGCQDEEFGFTAQSIRDSAYDRNFVQKYGEIEPDMDWDLTRQVVGAEDVTRANIGSIGQITTMNEWYYVESSVVQAFNDLLPEYDASNKQKGTTNFHLESNGTFYIIPMYQGQSGVKSELWMSVTYNGVTEAPVKVWGRSEHIQRQTQGSFEWNNLDNGRATFPYIDWYQDTENGKYLASTRAAVGIRSNPIKCVLPVGAEIKFFLKISGGHMNFRKEKDDYDRIAGWGTNGDWGEPYLSVTGDEMWSDKGMMIQLNANEKLKPTNISKFGTEYMFIACEDAWAKGERTQTLTYKTDRSIEDKWVNSTVSNDGTITVTPNDWGGDDDMNDLVFLFVSGKLPETKDATIIKKRYIIEDLGSIVDWDFNDIVVDMEQVTNTKTGTIQQKATLKHLCGTTPFELFVGAVNDEDHSVKLNFSGSDLKTVNMGEKTVLDGEIQDKSTELNYEFYLPQALWNPQTNNIWVRVYPKDRYSNEKHPEGGDYEYIHNDNDLFGGEMQYDYNNAVGNGEINSTFDYGAFINFAFPRKGKVPRIIAVNPDHEWTEEHKDIDPATWTVYKVNVAKTGGNGEVWGTGNYKPNTTIDIKAKAEDGYRFVKWNEDGNTNPERQVTITEGKTYTAVFAALTEEWVMSSTKQSGDAYKYSVTLNNDDFKNALKYGYNTVVVETDADGDKLLFALRSEWEQNPGESDHIIEGDALDYYFSKSAPGEYVLTPEQLKRIGETGQLIIQGRSNGSITKVTLKKTPDFYTVSLLPVANGHVEASDRTAITSWGNKDHLIENGNVAYKKAAYAADETVTLTPVPAEGYVFDHWEQYSDAEGTKLINTDKGGANGVITVKSTAILKAVFKEKGKLVYTITQGESIKLQYSFDNIDFADINSGSQINNADGKIYIRIKTGDDGFNVNAEHYLIDWQNGSATQANKEPGTAIEYDWKAAEGLSLILTIKYLVKPVITAYMLNGKTEYNKAEAGSVKLRAKGTDNVTNDQIFVPKGTTLELTATSKDGYKFKEWSNGTTEQFRTLDVTGYHNPYAYFEELDQTVYWQNDAGASVSPSQAFSKLCYGDADDFIAELTKITNLRKTSVQITFTFKSAFNGYIAFYTPYENAQHEGGWTSFSTHLTQNLTDAKSITQTFNADDIAKMMLFGGLVLQNCSSETLVVTQVNIRY